MKNKIIKRASICIAFLITCSIFCMNDVFASKKSPSDYEKISEQIAIDVEKYHIPGMAVHCLFYAVTAVHNFDSTFPAWHHTVALNLHSVLIVEK